MADLTEFVNLSEGNAEPTRDTGLAGLSDDALGALLKGEAAPATEDKPEATAPTPDAAEAAPAVEAAEVPAEELQTQLMALKLAEIEADNRRLQAQLGEYGGRIGHLQSVLDKRPLPRQEAREQDPSGMDDGSPEPERPTPPRAEPPGRDMLTAYTVGQAVSGAAQTFLNGLEDVYLRDEKGGVKLGANGAPEYDPEFVRAIQPTKERLEAVLSTDDPFQAAEMTRGILESAHWSFRRRRLAEHRVSLEKQIADQASRLKAKKKATAVTASTVSTPAGPERKPRSLQDVPTDDLNRYMEEHVYKR